MFRFLVIFLVISMALLYLGNYLDYKQNRITRKEFDRKIRVFILLGLVLIIVCRLLIK
ncbi:hypothetical protein [Pedobacter sp. SYP-B3415]|uniref:hypothetical protein n=1 Tax=Pedobacter sp. SYP-B3415 TaxID=2496641 RepID=UPI0013EADEA8|nr:hypothetical protein [Pedobacter sp. SYP-B3415]